MAGRMLAPQGRKATVKIGKVVGAERVEEALPLRSQTCIGAQLVD